MFIEIAIVVVAAAALLKLLVKPQPQAQFQPDMATSAVLDIQYDCPEDEYSYFDPPLQRVSYGTRPGASVYGWPAKGGLYTMVAAAVDLEFLGYDRFQPVPRPDPKDPNTAADEEAHCNKMRQLGAQWWESEYAWAECLMEVEEAFIATGWPAGGGVWVLSEDIFAPSRKHAGMLFNAYTMEERCNVIKKLGGTFYVNPKDCPDLDLA